ncbi:hypothetical protein [Aestuariivivens sediminicola]|uniref:hypothetical protein n=1 Tax=Aestuariivivens sediminicola TaxID=2913560 RepID=UPI001F56B1B6|nr:hypothetical protein [Aestuariivivens sediminicola]
MNTEKLKKYNITRTSAIKYLLKILGVVIITYLTVKVTLFAEDTGELEIVDITLIQERDKIVEFRKEWLKDSRENSKEFKINRQKQYHEDGTLIEREINVDTKSPREIMKIPENIYGYDASYNEFPILDIKLRNTSKEVVFIKSINIYKKTTDYKRNYIDFWAYPVTWEYTILLEPFPLNEELTIPLSQTIESNKVDRFVLILGSSQIIETENARIWEADYELNLTINFNEKDSKVIGEPINVKITKPVYFNGENKMDPIIIFE